MRAFLAYLSLAGSLCFGLVPGCSASAPDALPSTGQSKAASCVENFIIACKCDNLLEGRQACEGGKLGPCTCVEPKKDIDPSGKDRTDPAPTTTTDPATTPSVCGNALVESGEACDDGNQTDNDGCSALCQIDGNPRSADACPGQAVTVWKGVPTSLSGTMRGYRRDHLLRCYPASLGPDRVYQLRPSESGRLKIDAQFGDGFRSYVEVREGSSAACGTDAVVCKNTDGGSDFDASFGVVKDKEYTVIVAGPVTSVASPFTLTFSLQ